MGGVEDVGLVQAVVQRAGRRVWRRGPKQSQLWNNAVCVMEVGEGSFFVFAFVQLTRSERYWVLSLDSHAKMQEEEEEE